MSGRDGHSTVVDQAPDRRTTRVAAAGALVAVLGIACLAQALGATAALGSVGGVARTGGRSGTAAIAASDPRSSAQLRLKWAAIEHRHLNGLLRISPGASGTVRVRFRAGRRGQDRVRFHARIDSARGRIKLTKRLGRAFRRVRRGELVVTYPGDAETKRAKVSRAVPTAPDTRLTMTTISQLHRQASFTFKAQGEASYFQCKRLHRRHRRVRWRRCSSPRSYQDLHPGRYAFAVRAVGPGGSDPNPARRKLRIVRAPDPVIARFLTANDRDELVRLAARDGCLFAASQPDELRDMVLDFGGPRAYADGTYGALVNHVYEATNADILAALEATAHAYAYCHQRGEARIIYAVTNHFSTKRNAAQAAAIGADQARTVSALREFQRQSSYGSERAGVAGDVEMSWWGPVKSGEMVASAKAVWPHGYVDFGTAGGCPPLGQWPACANGWDLGDVGNVAYADGGRPLPEVYLENPDEAAQWVNVERYWNQRNDSGFRFSGATGSTSFSELTPEQSWLVLRDETDAPVGRELIDFQVDPPLTAGRQQARQTSPERPPAIDRTTPRQGPRAAARGLRRAGLPRRDIRSLSQSRRHPSAARFPPLRGARCPGDIVASPEPLLSSDLLWPLRNGWQTCNPRGFVAVQAGAYAPERGTGALGVFRDSYVTGSQGEKVVKVPGSGALRIVKAPLGAGVESWAHRRGEIEFVGERGVRGTLHLSDDSVTIER